MPLVTRVARKGRITHHNAQLAISRAPFAQHTAQHPMHRKHQLPYTSQPRPHHNAQLAISRAPFAQHTALSTPCIANTSCRTHHNPVRITLNGRITHHASRCTDTRISHPSRTTKPAQYSRKYRASFPRYTYQNHQSASINLPTANSLPKF